MPSVKNTPDKKQEEVRRACLQWELQQERHLGIFQRVTSPFFFLLSAASIYSTSDWRVFSTEIVSVASSLSSRNHQRETSANRVHSSESMDNAANHRKENMGIFGHSFVQINRKLRGRKKTNVQKNNFNRGVPILNKQPDQQRWFFCIYKSFLFSYGVDIGGFQVVKLCFWRGPSINTAPFRFSFFS